MNRRPSSVLARHLHLCWKSAFCVMALALVSGLLSACGSSGSAPISNDAVQSVCQEISAVLANGPDPDSDPVGYALAQVRPLKQIKTSDKTLQAALHGLSAAYEEVVTTKDSSAVKQAVTKASAKVNAICPGAAS